jgi:hypothetical protein
MYLPDPLESNEIPKAVGYSILLQAQKNNGQSNLLEIDIYLIFKNEGYLHLNPVLGDFASFTHTNILIFNPGRFDIPECFCGSFDALLDGVIETDS